MTNDEGPLTIQDAAPLIRSGSLTPSDLLEQCLNRIDVYEPHVKAWVYLDRERARKDAARLTDELKSGTNRGALHGIPIGIKDIIDVFDMPTGCGSKLWANSYARQDATCVERLRQAGAIILGKTVTTAYAYLDPPITRNPWNLERTPGGSSSGSAAAVACGMCLAALGTQTGGSLTRPASYCGVCSLKPTYGRVSVRGVLPLAPSLDHVGVIANCVRDLAVVFESIAGTVEGTAMYRHNVVRDIFGREYPEPEEPDYGKFWFLDRTDDFFESPMDPSMANALVEFSRRLTADTPVANRTAALKPNRLPEGFSTASAHHRTVMAVEAAVVHEERRLRHVDDYPLHIAGLIETGLRTPAVEYARAKDFQRKLSAEMPLRFRFLILPATTGPAPSPETTGAPVFNAPWSFVGAPTVSFPIGVTADGLPLAVQIVSKIGWEHELLPVAEWCEQVLALPRRLPPVPR